MFAHYNFVSVLENRRFIHRVLIKNLQPFSAHFHKSFWVKKPERNPLEKKKTQTHTTHIRRVQHSVFSNSITSNAYLYTFILLYHATALLNYYDDFTISALFLFHSLNGPSLQWETKQLVNLHNRFKCIHRLILHSVIERLCVKERCMCVCLYLSLCPHLPSYAVTIWENLTFYLKYIKYFDS